MTEYLFLCAFLGVPSLTAGFVYEFARAWCRDAAGLAVLAGLVAALPFCLVFKGIAP